MLMRMAAARSACQTNTCRYTTTVAAARPASVKNCQGWSSDPGGRGPRSVEVSELIVQAFVQIRIDRGVGPARRREPGLTRPPHGSEGDEPQPGDADRVREQPREAIEAFVHRRHQHFLAAELLDEGREHRVVILPFVQEPL